MKERYLPIAIILSGAACLLPGPAGAGLQERVRTYHVVHYDLALKIDGAKKSVDGTVTMTLVPLRPLLGLDVDADSATMSIRSVRLQCTKIPDAALRHRSRGQKLTLALPLEMGPSDTLAIAIRYACTPRNGLHFIQPDSAYPDLPLQVWSQGEMEDNHYWFPCYDYPNDKSTVEMRVTVNDRFVAISNGALLDVSRNPGERTATYEWYSAKPFSSYLISLIVGDYVKLQDHYGNIPLQYWVYPGLEEEGIRSFAVTPVVMRFYSSRIGYEYPWPKYAQTTVANFTYGGMENMSAATLTDRTLHDEGAALTESSDGLVAHELAHQWFGDLLTCRDWAHAWLNEGFATYFQALFDESRKGWDAFQYEMSNQQRAVTDADTGIDRRPTVSGEYAEPEDVFDARIYGRGACILHMLRFVLGDEMFWKGIHRYVDLHQYGNVTTDDFERAMESAAGQDLRWFFDEWTVHAGFPSFNVTADYDSLAHVVHLDIAQTQRVDSLTPLFKMPVAVELITASGSSIRRVIIEAKAEQRIDLPSAQTPLNVVFDKGSWILKTLRFDKPAAAWAYQLGHGDVAERIAALRELGPSVGEPPVLQLVGQVLAGDPFWGVRKEAAGIVGLSGRPEALTMLSAAMSDTSAPVRVAVVGALRNFDMDDAVTVLRSAFSGDSSYAVQAGALSSLMAIDPLHGTDYFHEGMRMTSYNDVIRAAAVRSLGTSRTPEARRTLLGLVPYGKAREVRLAAIDALVDGWAGDDSTRLLLEALTRDRTHDVRRRALEKLAVIASPLSKDMLSRFIVSESSGILKREARKALKRIEMSSARRAHS